MPTVDGPVLLFSPRSAMVVNAELKPFGTANCRPGTSAFRSLIDLMPPAARSPGARALMLIGIRSTDSSRRVAVTMTSCSAMPLSFAASAATAGGLANGPASVALRPTASTLLRNDLRTSLIVIVTPPRVCCFVSA